MSGIETLRQRNPWPANRPTISKEAEGLHGWCSGDNQEALQAAIGKETRVIVELGSWFGLSATLFCTHAPNATVICVDHWKGSVEHHRRPDWKKRLSYLYDGFLRNMWEYRNRVIPMRTTTVAGMKEIASLGIVPDLVYVDASHDEKSVYKDTSTALKLFPAARLFGDDWLHDSVRRGVVQAANRLWLRVHGINCWEIPLEKRSEKKWD